MVRSAVVLVAFVMGCGKKDPYDRQPLTGTVTFKGQPLDKGTIQFLPQDPASGFSSGALIQDGRFQVSREQGLPPGKYRVSITSPAPARVRTSSLPARRGSRCHPWVLSASPRHSTQPPR